jgi:hypothetical protein
MSSLRNTYYQNIKTQNAVLKWHLNDLLDNLTYQSVLDIGGSIGFAKDLCINDEVKTVFSVDSNGEFIREFLDCSNDSRFNIIEDNIESVDFFSADSDRFERVPKILL